MGLMDDLRAVFRYRGEFDPECGDAFLRLTTFISKHEPWYPPQQEGFGPWIEYKPGDKGPHVGETVAVLLHDMRANKIEPISHNFGLAWRFIWGDCANPIVAYCVKLDEAKP